METSFIESTNALLKPDYELVSEVGRGGMAVVYRATERLTDRAVAIKILPDVAFNPTARERFIREARIASALEHPGIIPIYRSAANADIAYIVMKLVEGESLAQRLKRTPKLGFDETSALLAAAAEALGHAHAKGVVHRDIKPDNIMIDGPTGRPFIMDFGIARARMGDISLTKTGNTMGTVAFMSPEQALGKDTLDGRSDIYSLGVMGYCMLAGELPFTANNDMALMAMHVSARPKPLRSRRPDVPESLVAVIERAMAKDRNDRWQTAEAFRDALGDVSAVAFTPMERALPVAPSVDAPVAAVEVGGLSPEMHGMVRVFQNKAIESVVLVAVCAVLNVRETPETWWTVMIAEMLALNLFLSGLRVWTEGITLRQMFTRDTRQQSPKLLQGTGPSAEFAFAPGIVVRELGMDADGIRMMLGQLGSLEREALAEVSGTIETLVARAQELGDELVALDTETMRAIKGAGSAAIALPRDEAKEGRRAWLAAKIEAAAAALMSLRLALLQAMRPDTVDGMRTVRESAARVVAVTRELSADGATEDERGHDRDYDGHIAGELPHGGPAGG